jgi:hypothetical protein
MGTINFFLPSSSLQNSSLAFGTFFFSTTSRERGTVCQSTFLFFLLHHSQSPTTAAQRFPPTTEYAQHD